MPRRPARSSTRSSARRGRSRRGRARRSRRWPEARCSRTSSAARTRPQLVAAITIVTGVLFLLLALLKLGWIAQFLSKAVITGFLAGAAIDVTIGELPKLTGTSSSGDSAWRELATWIQGLGEISWTTLVVGLVSLGVILGAAVHGARGSRARSCWWSEGWSRRACSTSARTGSRSSATSRAACRARRCPTGISSGHISRRSRIASVALLLIGFSQTAGDARAFATRHRYRIDVNQESVAQGMANAGAGVFQGMPVSTSLSASSLNESAGARTPVASLITGGLVLLTLIVLAPLFSHLPKAVLAAVIIDAVVFGMIDIGELRRLHRVARFDFWIAVAAILGVLSVGVLAGVAVGVALSLVWLIYVATSPRMPLLGREAGTQVFRELDEHPGDETFPGIGVVRLDSGLFFATAEALDRRVRAVIQDDEPKVHALVLDLEGVDFVDSQGAAKLAELHEVAGGRRCHAAPGPGEAGGRRHSRGRWDRRRARRRPHPRQRPRRRSRLSSPRTRGARPPRRTDRPRITTQTRPARIVGRSGVPTTSKWRQKC